MKRNTTKRPYVLIAVWIPTTIIIGWRILAGDHSFDSPFMWLDLLTLLVCTLVLLWWLSYPLRDEPTDAVRSKWGGFLAVVVIAVTGLAALRTFVGPPLLFGLPVVALAMLGFLRPSIDRKETLYALGLALIAGIAGLGAQWVPFHPIVWSVLQVALVSTGLLAGWAILRRTGLLEQGIGHSRFLSEGTVSAVRGLLQGMLLSLPWALGLVAMGGSNYEAWVSHWWQPLLAINPGIAEEAWGRMLLVPLLFLLLSRVSRPRRAFTVALIIIGYWFAFLHTSGGVSGLFSTVMIGTLYILPVSYICLYRDLETAIGFHFWVDFTKFAAAYLLNTGLCLNR